jgi:hypothetical protein
MKPLKARTRSVSPSIRVPSENSPLKSSFTNSSIFFKRTINQISSLFEKQRCKHLLFFILLISCLAFFHMILSSIFSNDGKDRLVLGKSIKIFLIYFIFNINKINMYIIFF